MTKKAIAIITARGGSKRIPRKNIRLFLGKPIIVYSITAAVQAGCFDEVMVSTDDQEIAVIAKQYGASVPFLRSPKTADDHATSAEVISEVLAEYKKLDQEFNYFCCLYPTAPFITAKRLQEALRLIAQDDVDGVFSITRFSYPIQRALQIDAERVSMIWPENMTVRSQDLKPTYHDAGQFYCLKTKNFLEQKKLFAERSAPIILNEMEVQDIDTEEDWKVAELKYQLLHPTTSPNL